MARKLDLGIASYGKNHQQLRRTIECVRANSVTDWTLRIVHNPSDDDGDTTRTIGEFAARDPRIVPIWHAENTGYAGAVNTLLESCSTPYCGYLDNDAEVHTHGWDEQFCALMDAHAEIGQVYPGSGHYGFNNGQYHECLWNAGYCWIARMHSMERMAERSHRYGTNNGEHVFVDTSLGHHEEVDLMIRLRLSGFRIACIPTVDVRHMETSTNANPADHKPGGRIHDGVVRFMNKWCSHFFGDELKYSMTAYDPRFIRYNEWPPCALYMERLAQHYFPQINASPRHVEVPGAGTMDVIEVLRTTNTHIGRSI